MKLFIKRKLFLLTFLISIILNSSCAISKEQQFIDDLQNIAKVENDRERYVKFLELYEKSNEYEQFSLLPFISKDAILINDLTSAQKYASLLLRLAEKYKNDWNYGNAVHDGNIVIGKVILESGDIEKATYHLLEAGKSPGSPQISAFGPSMMLAFSLLEAGESKTVIQYLQSCKKIWSNGKYKLDEWISLIEAGDKPDFGIYQQ